MSLPSSFSSMPVTGRRSAMVAPIACGCCLLAGAAYVAIDDPADGGAFLPCPFRAVTGWWCPGCGMTRATHHLLRGDLVGALRLNVLVIGVLGLIVVSWGAWMARAAGHSIDWVRRVPAATYGIAIAVVIAFAVVRNLPGIDGLRG